LPNRVLIRVTEREAAITLQSGDARYAVDSEGLVIPAPPMTSAKVSPVQVSQMLHPGEKMDPGAVATAHAIREIRPDVTGLVYTPERGVGLVTSQGLTVYLGTDPALLAEQLSLLDRLAPQLEARASQIEFLDLRFPGQPYIKEK